MSSSKWLYEEVGQLILGIYIGDHEFAFGGQVTNKMQVDHYVLHARILDEMQDGRHPYCYKEFVV